MKTLVPALLLSEPVGVDFTSLFVAGGVLLLLLSVACWWGGLRLVRSERQLLVLAGVVVLLVALASSIECLQLLAVLLGDSLEGITPWGAIMLLLMLATPFTWWGVYRLSKRERPVARPGLRMLLLLLALVGSALIAGAIALWMGRA